MSPSASRLLGLVCYAAVLPLLGLFVLLQYIATPTPTGGMEPTVTLICRIAFTVITFALCTVFVNFGNQLTFTAKGLTRLP
jgi:hypothetical protein